MQHRLLRTFIGTAVAAVAAQTAALAQQVHLNEIYANHALTDIYEMIELKGAPGTALTNIVVCVIEGEGPLTNQGTLDRAWDLTGYSIPASGYFVLGDTAVTPKDIDIGVQDRLENGTETFYLMDCGTAANAAALVAAIATDLDPDGDGLTTMSTYGTIIDIVGMIDATNFATPPPAILETIFDGAQVMGPDANNFPAGIYRGLDYPNAWCADFLDFDPLVNISQPRTVGTTNSLCPSAPPTIVNYCTPGTTSNGCLAYMSYVGVPSVSATSGFTVTCNNVEGLAQGIIFYGLAPSGTPWGTSSSFLCVKSPLERMGVAGAGGIQGQCNGSLSVDFCTYVTSTPGAVGTPFSAGNKVYLQGWFRDPPSPKTTMLSDGLDVTLVP